MRVMIWGLLAATIILVIIGSALYALSAGGWAQLMFVLASGTAGAGIVLAIGREK